MEHIVNVLAINNTTHDVRVLQITKPLGYRFEPGHATEVSINKGNLKDEKRPFTFTCLNDQPYLEFTIKIYDDHCGVTHEIGKLSVGDELIIRDTWGTISYRGAGNFIAGGAGITPFIAILRQLKKDNKLKGVHLYFSNKTLRDIILKNELDEMLGQQVHYIITDEEQSLYPKGYIDKTFLLHEVPDFTTPFYLCGPDKMVSDLTTILTELGASPDSVIFEK